MRAVILRSLLVALLLPLAAEPAPAQLKRAQRAAIGGAVGVAGGAAVTLSVIVARARFQREYLESADELIHWQSAPMLAAPAAGVVFGLAGEDALRASIVGSVGGMVIGAGLGAVTGWLLTDDQEGPWAGGVIGAGVGLATGGIVEGLRAWGEDENAELEFPNLLRLAISVPVR